MGYSQYNPNPRGRSVGDCAVRAVAKALGKSWEESYVGLVLTGFELGDLPNADSVWGAYLQSNGFCRHLLPDESHYYTVADFATDHPNGTFVLSMPGRHVVTVIDGDYCDSWDSGREVPTYYWSKER